MKFKIVYDKPGRIRFRCGAYAFEKELESAVQKAVPLLLKQKYTPKTAVFWCTTKRDTAVILYR